MDRQETSTETNDSPFSNKDHAETIEQIALQLGMETREDLAGHAEDLKNVAYYLRRPQYMTRDEAMEEISTLRKAVCDLFFAYDEARRGKSSDQSIVTDNLVAALGAITALECDVEFERVSQ
jgi:hypothetical protein